MTVNLYNSLVTTTICLNLRSLSLYTIGNYNAIHDLDRLKSFLKKGPTLASS